MIAAIDVAYNDNNATAACVVFERWPDAAPAFETTCEIANVAPYEPGQFYRRELPCILAVLNILEQRPDIIVIDGYVWLSDEQEPGLGGHLYAELEKRAAVIGVAKTRFSRAQAVAEICRGKSQTPLYITAAGLPLAEAASCIQNMHGGFRIPTLIRRADQLCRGTIHVQETPRKIAK
ncbi:MAG: endonuclease V [Alphaproteobacteria bacterium]